MTACDHKGDRTLQDLNGGWRCFRLEFVSVVAMIQVDADACRGEFDQAAHKSTVKVVKNVRHRRR